MSLISYNHLCRLVGANVIDCKPENINGASIDITIGADIMVERTSFVGALVDLKEKETLNMKTVQIPDEGYMLLP